LGLKPDRTVVTVGSNSYGQCNVGGWTDIVQIAASYGHTVGLKSDGTVVAVGHNFYGQCSVGDWTDVVQVAAGAWHTVGLKSDGTVVAVGYNYYGQCDVGNWTSITEVVAGGYHTVGFKPDRTMVTAGQNAYGQCNVGDWTSMVQVAAGYYHTVGLKSDGTVVAVGHYRYGELDVGSWIDIIQVTAGDGYTLGLTSNGIVVTVGSEVELAKWNLFEPMGGVPQCVATSTDTGMACFTTSDGTIEDLQAVPAPSPLPHGVHLPHGMFTFKVTGLSPGQSVTLTAEFPDPIPTHWVWWKYHDNTWSRVPITRTTDPRIITFTLTDNVPPGDEDSILGQITDQGGPGDPGSVGWETYPIDKMRVVLPWIALLSAVVGGAGLLVLRRRRIRG
jgi:hypothetical protein